MIVYAEYLFLDNFLIDLVLLLLVSKIVRANKNIWLVLLACALGTGAAFVFPLFDLPVWASVLLKLAVGVVMSVVAFAKQPFVVKIVGFVLFVVLTFCLGGATMAFIYLLTKNTIKTFSVSYYNGLPVGLLVFAVFCVCCFGMYLWKYVRERKAIAPFLRNMTLCVCGQKMELFGYLDTGNRLQDDVSGLPIVVVSKQSLFKNLNKETKEKIENCNFDKKQNAHFVEAQSATGKSKMLVFRPEFLMVANQKKNALIGICETKFSELVRVDALFGPALD